MYALNEELEGFEKAVADKNGYLEKINALISTLESKSRKCQQDEKDMKVDLEKLNISLNAEKYTRNDLETQVYKARDVTHF